MYQQDFYIWFDLTSHKYFLLPHSEIIENLKALKRIFKVDYLEMFSNYVQDEDMSNLTVTFQSQDIVSILKITKEEK